MKDLSYYDPNICDNHECCLNCEVCHWKKLIIEKEERSKNMLIIEKTRKANRITREDISLRIYESKGTRGVNIILRNDIHKYITTSGYIRFGVSENRLYFMETDSKRGYKVSESKGARNKYINVQNETLIKWVEKYGGDYFMKFAPEDSMGYIEGKSETAKSWD